MLTKQEVLKLVEKKGTVKTSDFVHKFDVSRQYAARLVSELVDENRLVKIGSTHSAFYTTEEYLLDNPSLLPTGYTKTLLNEDLEEHLVYEDVKKTFLARKQLPENVMSIIEYAFSEMLNNAIEHSESDKIRVSVSLENDTLSFVVDDFGVGVFRNIMTKRGLKTEMNAIRELLKGKTTTAPRMHSGEGIFFTSKVASVFTLDSYGYQLIVNNDIKDVFIKKARGQKQGTRVTFDIESRSKLHLNDVFKEYTNVSKKGDYGFDKTKIFVKLYTIGGVHVSRSQARRVLSGLDKFQVVVMDYERVSSIGQAFADEVYRVFKEKHPNIEIQDANTNETVQFMIDRSKK